MASRPLRLAPAFRTWLTLLLSAIVLGVAPHAGAYSLLTHEQIVDIVWKDQIEPMLLQRFPASTPEELRQAHAYAYGGCLVQDLGYYPFGSSFFSDLAHYLRTGDFVTSLLKEAVDLNEYAFALGALEHYSGDNSGHPFINQAVALGFPELRAKYGPSVTYEDAPWAHVATEFGFDMIQVAKNRYTSNQYRDFIGFQISRPVVERAFTKTYGLQLQDVLQDVDLAIGTFRHGVSGVIPAMTRAAMTSYHPEEVKEKPTPSKSQFLFNISRADYEQQWGNDYRKPGWCAKLLGDFLRLIPKIGPMRSLRFKTPTPAMENLYFKSVNQATEDYRQRLREVGQGNMRLNNRDCDTGQPTRLGEYALCDKTYALLVEDLLKRGFARVPPDLRASLLSFYDAPPPPHKTRGERKAWRRTEMEVEVLRDAPGSASEDALRLRFFHPPRGLESPKAKDEHD